MAGRGDIKAGAAFVELYLKNKMTQQLTGAIMAARKQLLAMASAARFVGGTLNQLSSISFKAGSLLTGPFIAALANLEEGKRIFSDIGKALTEALGKPLLPILRTVRGLVLQFTTWAKKNPELIRTIFKIGVALVAAGVAFKALGSFAIVSAAAFVAAGSALGVLATVVGALLSPIGLIAVALAAGTAAWIRFTKSGRESLAFLGDKVRQFGFFLTEVFGGIADAIGGGDLRLAAKIAADGINVAWHTIRLTAVTVWEDIKLSVLGAYDEIRIAARTTNAFIGELWNGLTRMIAEAFPAAMTKAVAAWKVFKLAGLNALEGLAKAANMLNKALGKAIGGIAKIAPKGMGAVVGEAAAAFKETNIGAIIDAAADKAAAEGIKARREVDIQRADRREGRDAAVNEAARALAKAQDELAKDRKKAEHVPALPAFELGGAGAMRGSPPAVTFSPTALLASGWGGGGGPMQQIAKNGKKQVEVLGAIHKDIIKLGEKKIVMGN